jgi:hypothetical protein
MGRSDDSQTQQWVRIGIFFAAVIGLSVFSAWLIDRDQVALALLVYAPAVWLAWPRRH